MTSKDTLNLARSHHHAGKLADAEKIYRQILDSQPNHAEAMQLLGALVGQRGDIESAIDLIGRSIRLNPRDGEAYRNLGVLFAQRSRFDEALASFSQAARLRPDDAHIHHNMAKIFSIQGKWDEAVAAYRRVVEIKPDFAEIHKEIGNILGKQGQYDEAIPAFLAAIKLKADFAFAHLGLGHVYRSAGQFEEALVSYRNAVQFKPDLLEAHTSMAIIYAKVHRFEEAMACHARAVEIKPDSAVAEEVLGWIMLRKNDETAATEHFRRATVVDPKLLSAWNSLGLALQYQGEFEQAAECFRRILAIRPDIAIAHKHLVNTSRQSSDSQIEPLQNLLLQPNLSIEDRASAEFALATAFDDAGRYDEAFPHVALANALVKQQRAAIGERYDAGEFRARVDRLMEIFTPDFFKQRRGWGEPSELPVFVVGMPRSGTTLAQQIAGSHPQVFGAGELNGIFQLSELLNEAHAPHWNPEKVKDAASRHLAYLRDLKPEAARVIDKMPSNLHHLGLIALLYPKTRVIVCRRDARDTCLSNYFQPFSAGNIFSYDLSDCGQYHRENDRLAAYWLRVLPIAALEFRYEEVVADLEGQSRRLIDFLGLPWDPSCLEFYRAKTTVLTSSVWQVRQPIYQGSVGRWRHYERHLGPLLKSLDV